MLRPSASLIILNKRLYLLTGRQKFQKLSVFCLLQLHLLFLHLTYIVLVHILVIILFLFRHFLQQELLFALLIDFLYHLLLVFRNLAQSYAWTRIRPHHHSLTRLLRHHRSRVRSCRCRLYPHELRCPRIHLSIGVLSTHSDSRYRPDLLTLVQVTWKRALHGRRKLLLALSQAYAWLLLLLLLLLKLPPTQTANVCGAVIIVIGSSQQKLILLELLVQGLTLLSRLQPSCRTGFCETDGWHRSCLLHHVCRRCCGCGLRVSEERRELLIWHRFKLLSHIVIARLWRGGW